MTKIFVAVLFTVLAVGCSPVKDDGAVQAPPTAQALSHDLYQAIADQDVNQVELIVDNGADLTMHDDRGYTPLMRAVQIGNSFIVETLISGGSKIYQPRKDDSSTTAFTMVGEPGSETHRLFESERVRLAGIVQSKIIKAEFDELIIFQKTIFCRP